jgi:hypothetical protein
MKIQPAATWIAALIIIAVGLLIAACGLLLALRGERSGSVATFIIVGAGIIFLGASQLGGPPLRRRGKTDKPLDKPTASRHLAGPGRTWRPR